jgi:hypothetical protein
MAQLQTVVRLDGPFFKCRPAGSLFGAPLLIQFGYDPALEVALNLAARATFFSSF